MAFRRIGREAKLVVRAGALALLTAAAVASCSGNLEQRTTGSSGEGSTGTVGLVLQPVTGVTVNTVHYVVMQAGSATPVREGDLPTPGSASSYSLSLALPIGSGYSISLSAVAVESATTTCAGSFGPFDVAPNAGTALKIALACTDVSTGSSNPGITIQTEGCPRLVFESISAAPSSANIGGKIALVGAARDLDGKAVTYAWTVSDAVAGSFAPANTASSVFTCAAAGTNLVATLTANNGECTKPLSTTISCTSITCGNGQLDPGETCDPTIPVGQPGFGPCPANCHYSCGNGIVESPAEQCDPPSPSLGCGPTCQSISECGDGFIQPGEECDGNAFPPGTPADATCTATCKISIVVHEVICGSGITTPPVVCSTPFTADNCGSDCHAITKPSCVACESSNGNCPATSCDNVIGNAAAGPASGVARAQLCNEVLDCVRDSGCAAGGNLPIRCYCGTANPTQCSAGQGNGACKAQIERGLETTDFNSIASRFGNTAFGAGKAMDRINCDQTFCDNTATGQPSGPTDPSECF